MTVNHHRVGSGPPLVLLHGVGHHWQAWQPVLELLARDFEVLACDLPGFGRSEALAPGVDPTVPAYADAFVRWFAEQRLERPHVAGHSMGGAIALELADRGAVASATALSPAGFWTRAERRFCQLSLGVLARIPRPLRPGVVRLARTRPGRAALFAQLCAHPARIPADEVTSALLDVWAAPSFLGALDAFSRYRYAAPAQAAGVPVIVAWAARDRLLPYRLQAPRARRELPAARHVVLGAGHIPFTDDSAAVAEVIRSNTR
jgi:pimeloyl-ACP methyl ester carboxylesterase